MDNVYFPDSRFLFNNGLKTIFMPIANDIRRGMAINYNGDVAVVLETQHRSAEIGAVETLLFAVTFALEFETFVLMLMFDSVPVPRHPAVKKMSPGRISPQADIRAIALFIVWSPDSS